MWINRPVVDETAYCQDTSISWWLWILVRRLSSEFIAAYTCECLIIGKCVQTQIFLLVLCCQASNIICKYTLEAEMHMLSPTISLQHADMLSHLSFSRSHRCCNCTANNLKHLWLRKRICSCNTVKNVLSQRECWSNSDVVSLNHNKNVKYVICIWQCSVFHPFASCWYPDDGNLDSRNTWIPRNRNCSIGCTTVFWSLDGWRELFLDLSCRRFR